jgi:hypothetical protein
MKFSISILIIIIVLFSCNSDNGTSINENRQVEGAIKKDKKKVIGELVSKYNIQYSWDTIEYKYSIEYKSILQSKYQLIDRFEVGDIFEVDSTSYISIRTQYYPAFYFTLAVHSEQINEIINDDEKSDLIIVVNITNLKKPFLMLDIEEEHVNGEEEYPILSPSLSDDGFIGKGQIVEIIFLKNE